jgi:hypothetical protein
MIPDCPFLVSDHGGPWTADFDWFVKPDSVTKILEGCYAEKPAQGGKRFMDRQAELGRVAGREDLE